LRGERISKQKGVSIEFSDYREYTTGDDLRHLDWNILARLDRPTIRTYQDEDDLAVYILLDASASMSFGSPSKFTTAQKIAVALGFIGLCGQDRVTPVIIGMPGERSVRGRASLTALNRWAGSAAPVSHVPVSQGIQSFLKARGSRPGMVVCITDGLDPDAPAAIRSIGARGHESVVIQILSKVDLDPEMEGDLRLIDSESDPAVEITATDDAITIYRQNLAGHCREVERSANSAGGRYLRVESHQSVLDLITHDLRHIKVID
jgi:uncharacterized protein (DUF58 family)